MDDDIGYYAKIKAGWCACCGYQLIQSKNRTYHPASTAYGACPMALLIPGTVVKSSDFSPIWFVENPEDLYEK